MKKSPWSAIPSVEDVQDLLRLLGMAMIYDDKVSSGTKVILRSLSINLPRLAYQSNRDETYFRATKWRSSSESRRK